MCRKSVPMIPIASTMQWTRECRWDSLSDVHPNDILATTSAILTFRSWKKKRRPLLIARERRTKITIVRRILRMTDPTCNSSPVLFSAKLSLFFPFSPPYIYIHGRVIKRPRFLFPPLSLGPDYVYYISWQRVLNYLRCPVTSFRRKKLEHNRHERLL